MKQFVNKLLFFLILSAIPSSLLIGSYVYFDPFMVVKKHNNFTLPHVLTDRDYVSTEMFLNNRNKYNYNSFIFGSSRTIGFRASSWQKCLHKGDSPFSFDASAETLFGIYRKVRLLDSLNTKIDNALVIICRDASFLEYNPNAGHLFIKDPRVSGESKFTFQVKFMKVYVDPVFMYCFYNYIFTHRYKEYMKGYIEDRRITYDSITNEMDIVDQDKDIVSNPHEYYEKRKAIFYPRQGETIDSVQRIKPQYLAMLKEMKSIFDKHHTDYKIVLSPLYDQIKFSNDDMFLLHNLFGNHVYDFTGKNYFTDDITHYYESSHFRPLVGDSIMSMIY